MSSSWNTLWLSLSALIGLRIGQLQWKRYSQSQLNDKISRRKFCVGICGAGFSGICMAVKLKEKGIPFVIWEENEKVGGTWFKNNYPGAACDVISHLYSYSFCQNPDWSRIWSNRDEILNYIEFVVDKYELRKHIKFSTSVDCAKWNDETSTWLVTHRNAVTHVSEATNVSVFVSAVGQLNCPNFPAVPGIDSFKGPSFHTAEWRHDIDITDKVVVGIGTGPSAIQAFPEVAKTAKHLHVIQRSPVYVMSKDDREYFKIENAINRLIPPVLYLRRWVAFLLGDMIFYNVIHQPRDNKNLSRAHLLLRSYILKEMQSNSNLGQCQDLKTREALIPEYTLGCKRIGLSNDWLPMMCRSNVSLVTAPFVRVTENGVVVKDKSTGKESSIPCDILIWATGFKATSFLNKFKVFARGRELHEFWNNEPKAYKGITVAGYPNFYILYGPNTNLGSNSIITMIECQVSYIMQCLEAMLIRQIDALEVKQDAFENNVNIIQERLHDTVFQDNCDSWYKTTSGYQPTNWCGSVISYWYETLKPCFQDYNLVRNCSKL